MVKAWLGIVGAVIALMVLSGLDRWIVLHCDRFQQRRLIVSNYVGVVLFLVPVALRCVKGSWTNTLCDLICYSGGVCLVAYGLAARVEPLLGKIKVFMQGPVILFPIILVVYGIVLGWQMIALYNAYGIEWADFAFEFPPFWQSLRAWPFRMIDVLSYETNLLQFHWPLIYLPLAPVTFLWKDPRVTLVLLTLFFTITGYAVYLLALQHTGSKNAASVMGIAFMAYLPVHCAHLSGLHLVASRSIAMSAFPFFHASIMRGNSCGGCCRSASMVTTARPCAASIPAVSAACCPKFLARCIALTHGLASHHLAMIAGESSLLPSSTRMTS
jgi:hypothetical protein